MDKAISVLVVDDEKKMTDVIGSFLESKGFSVSTASSGPEALQAFEKGTFGLVLLDLMLPLLSGEEVCRAIRRKSRVPIIMLTAKSEEADLVEGLELGADDYITKPFSLKTLFARIEAVLRRAKDAAPLFSKASFRDGDLEIDTELRTVRKRGAEVRLTRNEYRILIALVTRPGKVFTRDELISLAMGDEFEGFDRAIDTHIKNLRQKIETDAGEPRYINTVHGVGYRFDGE